MNLAPELARGLEALGLSLGEDQQAALLRYLGLLEKWNQVYNLTAVREPERMLTLHLLDSLAVLAALPELPAGLSLLDVGSGGGLPGIPLSIAQPGWEVTLLEVSQKKASFLRQACAELGLANARVAQQRLEDFGQNATFDLVISRAFSDLKDFLQGAARLVKPGGLILAMKGVHPDEEIAQIDPQWVSCLKTVRMRVPGLDAERHLLTFQKPT